MTTARYSDAQIMGILKQAASKINNLANYRRDGVCPVGTLVGNFCFPIIPLKFLDG